jgi:hypothetical protein
MSLRKTALAFAIGAVAVGGVAATAALAGADTVKHFTTYAAGTCDTATGEWVVAWEVTNQSDETATVGDVTSTPDTSPAEALPATVDGGYTVRVAQRIPGSGGQTARLVYTATWADGTSTLNSWDFRPQSPCAKAADPGPWAIVDGAGKQRGTLTYNPSGQMAMACYGGPDGDVVIEEKFTTGGSIKRVVPQFGCAVAIPYAGTGDVVAVRASVGDFANPWHEVG